MVSIISAEGERLTLEAFQSLSGKLAGHPFVKVVLDREALGGPLLHFINNKEYPFHADYIATEILKIGLEVLERDLEEFNRNFYATADQDRRFFLGILALYNQKGERFFSLETVEVDTMDEKMLRSFYASVKERIDPQLPFLFKPANHRQEAFIKSIDPGELPRVFNHELFASSRFIALNSGCARGRLRAFRNEAEYRAASSSLEWFDIIAMHRVPDDIPRVAGIINAHHVTPLSHTNVLASGWKIPNAIELGVFDRIQKEGLNGQWVDYEVDFGAASVVLRKAERPDRLERPAWSLSRIQLEAPQLTQTPILELGALRMADRFRYGTKAANLGELRWLLQNGGRLPWKDQEFLRQHVRIPRGIALPFSAQQQFLEGSSRIQQAIGRLKTALELGVREIDAYCLAIQSLIRSTPIPQDLWEDIESELDLHLEGVSSFVVRSSSNAEDLEGFSAAGIYESLNHVARAEKLYESIKEVWASLLSPRSVRLRQDVGIPLDDCYMGVIIQEEVAADMGGVLVTTNPLSKADRKNVYINVSTQSVNSIVRGDGLPIQYLYNTVDGGGRTLSIGDAKSDLDQGQKDLLERLAVSGRLLQSYFATDSSKPGVPVDIEWIANSKGLSILQLRPYAQ